MPEHGENSPPGQQFDPGDGPQAPMNPLRRHVISLLLVLLDFGVGWGGLAYSGDWHAPKALPGALFFLALTHILSLHRAEAAPGRAARLTAIGLSAVLWWIAAGLFSGNGPLPLRLPLFFVLGSEGGRIVLGALCRLTRKPLWVEGWGPRSRRLAQALRQQPFGDTRFAGHLPRGDGRQQVDGGEVLSWKDKASPGPLFGLDGQPWIRGQWMLFPAEGPGDGVSCRLKRVLDLILALILLPVVGLAVLLLAVFLRLCGYRHPFYRQIRLTLGQRPFTIHKLRTMPTDAEPQGQPVWPSAQDPRMTRPGKLLRQLWLDELPQIWNVLRGDLSWVGPRPERPEFAQVFTESLPKYPLRHRTRAGVTGLAQIRGFVGNTSLRKRLACDLEYIRSWSPWLDVAVLSGTLCQILARRRQPVFDFVPGQGDRIP